MPRPGTVFFGGLPTSFDRRDIERLVAGYGPYDDIDFKVRSPTCDCRFHVFSAFVAETTETAAILH
ncbi:MAG: hypothetical protein BJ554DRAFT_4488 [Olpidium bornovanus]|uniref:RRM domain-containing protein n=1 Tax=Olpidium bornovanus TaxID=278681 RepID=A0A8H8A0A6_9FUNG|nr:MAG: hypothetical protein BJ554DRAFT_4488 [Olpidium bornovanus]